MKAADLSSLMSTGYKFPQVFKVKADDGITDLYGVMYKPFDFDSTKKYPIIDMFTRSADGSGEQSIQSKHGSR